MESNTLSKAEYNYKPKPCRTCGETFQPHNSCHVHCSLACLEKSMRSKYLRRNYGITEMQHDEMFNRQGGVCAICGRTGFKMNPKAAYDLSVDHCHTSGKVRGLLCHNCNRGLGLFGDNVEWLRSATTYLEENK